MRNCVGMTGTPGTGKKTLASLVASKIGLPCISLHDQAVASGLTKQGDADAEVDTTALGRYLVKHMSEPALICGHLLPYVVRGQGIGKVAVLRCEPKTLKRRLLARGYELEKVLENVEAELIGVLSTDSIAAFGIKNAAEFDTTKAGRAATATAVSEFLKGNRELGPRIDWTFRYDSAAKLRSLLSVRSTEPNST